MILLVYLKTYPTDREQATILSLDRRTTMKLINIGLKFLSEAMFHIQLARESRFNDPLPHIFDHLVSGSVDSFPVYTRRPKDRLLQCQLYNGKYSGHVMKFTIVVNNVGQCTFVSHPRIGTRHDSYLFQDVERSYPFIEGERLLGDLAYIGKRDRVIAPFRKLPGSHALGKVQHAFNKLHSWYRSTVEHSIGFAKRFRIIGGTYRGKLSTRSGMSLLRNTVVVIFNIDALCISYSPLRVNLPNQIGIPRFDILLNASNDALPPNSQPSPSSNHLNDLSFDDFTVGQYVEFRRNSCSNWYIGRIQRMSRRTQSFTLLSYGSRFSGVKPQDCRPILQLHDGI